MARYQLRIIIIIIIIINIVCMEHGYLPPTWLQALISPFYKKGNNTDPHSYRP